jgi:Zn-dependent peptidase ImmA (M78 family)
MPKVNPNILTWAREMAGLSLEEGARKLGISGEAAAERLAALEQGRKDPSRSMLVRMSEKYRRPLLTFYLPNPPRRSDKGQDFRTLPEASASGTEALLDALLRDIHTRQGLVKAALEEAEEATPLAFVGSARIADGVDAVVASIRETLGVALEEYRRQRSGDEAFTLLRSGAEKAGVFVLLMGNLGSHHTKIDVRVFRGFALADPVAPFIVINEGDSRAAWSFTLLHELVHLWLGATGVSGYDGEAEVETFCNAVAARFMLDPRELLQLGAADVADLDELKERIDLFANERNLSRKMVAYNLLQSGAIAAAMYRQLCEIFDVERAALMGGGAEGEGGPNYYVVRRHRVGPALVDVVRRMVEGGTLTTTEAGRVLGVKPTNVARLVQNSRAA